MRSRLPLCVLRILICGGIPAILLGTPLVPAQQTPPGNAAIPGEISDGTPSPPAPKPALPDFEVKGTVVREMHVVEAPPMSGLPPVEGTIRVTVNLVEDPKLPDPAPPVPPEPPDPLAKEPLAGRGRRHAETRHAFVSATVYDRDRTLLACYPGGGPHRVVKAWSNLDFNHFSGFGSFEAKDGGGGFRKHSLIMSIGNEDSGAKAALLASGGVSCEAPEIPAIPDGPPAFVVLTENPDPRSLTLIKDLHALHAAEGPRMRAAFEAREKAYRERKAYLLAHPPKPEDITIHFWKREHPVGMSAATVRQGGGS